MNIAFLPIAGSTNPYQMLTMQAMRNVGFQVRHGDGHKIIPLIRTFCTYRPEAIHLDWIQSYTVGKNPLLTILKSICFIVDLIIVRCFTRVKLYWTVHNLVPHGHDLKGINFFMRKVIMSLFHELRFLNEYTANKFCEHYSFTGSHCIIPEGNYIDYYSKFKLIEIESKELVYVGLIKPYKGVVNMLNAVREINGLNIEIFGECRDRAYLMKIDQVVRDLPTVKYTNKHLSESLMCSILNKSKLILLPYERIDNSGSIIMAMGFGKLVLAPLNGLTKELLAHQQELLFVNYEDIPRALRYFEQLTDTQRRNLGDVSRMKIASRSWMDLQKLFKDE